MMPSEIANAYGEKKKQEKKYYFLKLSTSFFKDKAIKKLRKLPGGDTYALITLEIFLEALENDNRIYYDGIEDSFAKELALSIDENPEAVQIAVDFLLSYGWLIEENPETYYTPKGAEMSGQMSARTERRHRAQSDKLTAECPQDVRRLTDNVRNIRNRNRNLEIELEIEGLLRGKDLKALFPDAFTCGKPKASPSLQEIQAKAASLSFHAVSPESFHGYFNALGWTVDGSKITDWLCLYIGIEGMARRKQEGAE